MSSIRENEISKLERFISNLLNDRGVGQIDTEAALKMILQLLPSSISGQIFGKGGDVRCAITRMSAADLNAKLMVAPATEFELTMRFFNDLAAPAVDLYSHYQTLALEAFKSKRISSEQVNSVLSPVLASHGQFIQDDGSGFRFDIPEALDVAVVMSAAMKALDQIAAGDPVKMSNTGQCYALMDAICGIYKEPESIQLLGEAS